MATALQLEEPRVGYQPPPIPGWPAGADPEAQSIEALPKHIPLLAGHIRTLFETWKTARALPEQRMLRNIRMKNSEYEPAKYAAIVELMGPMATPPFMKICEAKTDAVYGWLIDAILPPGVFPANIEPTPMPDLPDYLVTEIESEVMNEVARRVEMAYAQGMTLNASTVRAARDEMMKQARKEMKIKILEHAKEAAKEMFLKIQDQFAEGDWEKAFRAALHDLVDVGTAIMSGPVLRTVGMHRRELNMLAGRWEEKWVEETIPQFDRYVPLRFYPSSDATRDSLPGSIYIDAMTRMNLSDLLGVDGYDEAAIRKVLREHKHGFRENTLIEQQKAELEEKSNIYDTELIDCLRFKGSISGSLLIEYGVDDMGELDPEREYECLIWQIGSDIIKALLNPQTVGLNHIFSAAFSERPDSFWGVGVPEKMEHSVNIANMAAVHIVMNAAMGSGPMAEFNSDRVGGQNMQIRPWATFPATNAQMMESKAIQFYQTQMVTDKLTALFEWAMNLADHETNFPRILYAGTASTPTASASAMAASQASKGAMSIVRNIDIGLIIPSVQKMFRFNMQYGDNPDIIGDLRIVARASGAQVAKEQKIIRLKETLVESNNPNDINVITIPIRAKLWKILLTEEGIDSSVMGMDDEIERRAEQIQMQMQNQQMMMQAGPTAAIGADGGASFRQPPAARMMDDSGQLVAGRDSQLFQSEAGMTP